MTRIFLFSLFLLLGVSQARADGHLNCSAYAALAVAQQEQNAALECGFSGGGWTADYQAHFQWCNTAATMADLTREDTNRKMALLECANKPKLDQAACQEYANDAVYHSRIASIQQCGLTGGAYNENYAPHFDWCLTADQAARDSETSARLNQLQGCLAAKTAAREVECSAYAQTAVIQQEENASKQCGFTGGRWSTNADAHYNWCMGAEKTATEAEADIRNASLRDNCEKTLTTRCWTESRPKFGLPPWEIKQICRTE